MTASETIDKFGGPTAFAAAVGVDAGLVRMWKYRDHLPRNAWPEISLAFPELTLARLMEIEAGRPRGVKRAKAAA